MTTRKEMFKWIGEHEKTLYSPRQPIKPIGVYFSPQTRNYFADEFMSAYKGILYLLLQAHLEFQILTPRTLASFSGEILILPDAKCLSEAEVNFFAQLVKSGKTLLVTGETGKYNGGGQMLSINPLHERLGIADSAQPQHSNAGMRFSFYPNCPGKAYYEELERTFDERARRGDYLEAPFYRQLMSFANELTDKPGYLPAVEIKASPFVSTQIALVNGKPHVFIANFKGLQGKENAAQMPEKDVTIVFPAKPNTKIYALPYLGEIQEAAGEWRDGKLICVIPEINKGVVVWCE